MRSFITAFIAIICTGSALQAQYRFINPTHYHGIFSDQLSSARAQGMGYTTITIDGISTSIYNPATISPGNNLLDVYVNYAKGHPYFPKSYYPFVGVSYRIMPKLVVGASMFAWIDPDSYWSASIMGQDIDTKKKTQHLYSITAAYEILQGLHFGASGNFMREKAVEGTTTMKDFILSTGLIYDRKVNFIRHPKFQQQQIRGAISLVNTLMKGETKQTYQNLLNYRDLPIIARLGAAYSFSMPLSFSFTKNTRYFDGSPEILDLSLRLQYQNFLKSKKHFTQEHKYSTAFGIGAEAWFMKLLALRMGYYTETRDTHAANGQIVVTTKRKGGFTWGFGGNIPLPRLTKGKVPIEIEANFVTSRMMNEVDDKKFNIPEFRDKRFQFCAGLNIRWQGKKK